MLQGHSCLLPAANALRDCSLAQDIASFSELEGLGFRVGPPGTPQGVLQEYTKPTWNQSVLKEYSHYHEKLVMWSLMLIRREGMLN